MISGLLNYLVVMVFHDKPNQVRVVEQPAPETGITFLGDNYTSLAEPVE